MGLGVVFIGKKEAFWGPLGWFLRKFGGVPVDRSAPGGIVDQVATQIHAVGTHVVRARARRHAPAVEKWKPGFWKIARRAQVPVFYVGFHYPDRTIRLGELVELTDDMEADMRRIRALFAQYRGKHRDV